MKRLYNVCYENFKGSAWNAITALQVVAESPEQAKHLVLQRCDPGSVVWGITDMGPYPMADYPDNEE